MLMLYFVIFAIYYLVFTW